MKHSFEKLCVERLQGKGMRVTSARREVAKTLSRSKHPRHVREIFAELSAQGSSIDKVTVYRVVETFLELGLVHSVDAEGRCVPCFHQNCRSELHMLLCCESCGEVFEEHLPARLAKEISQFAKKKLSFAIQSHVLQAAGRCKRCQKKKS